MAVLLDTNVAVRAVMRTELLHTVCIRAIAQITERDERLVVGAQVLAESWSLLTRPLSNKGGFGLSVSDADIRISQMLRLATLLPEPPDIWNAHRELLVSCGVSGTQVHDCRLAAWCLLHGVDSILTLNSTDFARYGVRAVNPNDM